MHDRLEIVRPPDLRQQLDAAAHSLRGDSPAIEPVAIEPAALMRITALLACGEFERVRELLRTAAPGSALPLAFARYTSWSADLAAGAAAWAVVLESMDHVAAADAALRAATYTELPRLATDLGDVKFAARMHELARTGRTADARVPDPSAAPDARTILDVVFDVLGLDPDATRGRLALRPRLDRFDVLEARHIRFADASIDMAADRTGDVIAIRIEQVAGAIPITALLEPVVPAMVRAEVDGVAADLEARPVDGGVVVPVQLVLDDARSLVISIV